MITDWKSKIFLESQHKFIFSIINLTWTILKADILKSTKPASVCVFYNDSKCRYNESVEVYW